MTVGHASAAQVGQLLPFPRPPGKCAHRRRLRADLNACQGGRPDWATRFRAAQTLAALLMEKMMRDEWKGTASLGTCDD